MEEKELETARIGNAFKFCVKSDRKIRWEAEGTHEVDRRHHVLR